MQGQKSLQTFFNQGVMMNKFIYVMLILSIFTTTFLFDYNNYEINYSISYAGKGSAPMDDEVKNP